MMVAEIVPLPLPEHYRTCRKRKWEVLRHHVVLSNPYMGPRVKACGCGITAFSSFIFLHPSFFVRLEKPVSSPRPTLDERRRAQDLSRTRTCAPVRALSLTGPSTAADLGKLGLRRATVSGSASCQATAKRPLNLISGRLEWEPNPYPTYWGRKRPGWTGTIFWPALKP